MQQNKNKKENKKLLILIITLILIDQIVKICMIVFNIQLGVLDGWRIQLQQLEKTEENVSYILISIIAIILLTRYIRSNNTYIKMDSKVVLSFAIAGAISNTIDRIWNRQVINYIHIPKFGVINLSYVYIIITWLGMALILTKYTMNRIREKKQKTGGNNEKNNNSKR